MAAAFRHRTSRAGDPALHTHVVVANTTEAEGRWSALDTRHLYRHAKTAGYLYQAALRAQLTQQLGVRWTTVTNGSADVLGVPRSLIEHFSRRRADILEHMAERGERSARAADVAALETRRTKSHTVPIDRLRADWSAHASEQGFGREGLDAVLARTERFPEEELAFAREAVDAVCLDEVTQETSAFDRRDVLRAWAARQRDGAEVASLERVADDWLASSAATPLEADSAGPWERRFSTPEMLSVERELIETSAASRGEGAGQARASTVDEVLARRSELSDEQAHMVRALTESGDGVQVVRAAAGTGKTYALGAAREAWEAEGLRVFGCALSARAAVELRDQAGMDTSTLARLQLDIRHGHNLTPQTVLVVDEAATIGTRDLAEIARHADEMGAKLVLAGDDRQLPEIEAGGAFAGLAKRLGAVELTDVRRQYEAWDREALAALRDGSTDDWLEAYRQRGHIRGAPDAASTRAQLVEDWWRSMRKRPDDDAIMIAHRRSDVADLNARARERMARAGALGAADVRAADRSFATGDHVIAARNDRRAGITNGTRGRVIGVDPERRAVEVDFGSAGHAELAAGYLDEGHLEHGYALTAHRAQGTTVDRSFVLGSDELYREWGYTAMTRHRETAFFYVTVSDGQLHLPGTGIEDEDLGLDGPLSRRRAKEMATDILTRRSGAAPSAERDLDDTAACTEAPRPFDSIGERSDADGLELTSFDAADLDDLLRDGMGLGP